MAGGGGASGGSMNIADATNPAFREQMVRRYLDMFGNIHTPPQAPGLGEGNPDQNQKETAAKLEAEAAQERKIRGRASTILTSGAGLTDPAPTSKRTLLGY